MVTLLEATRMQKCPKCGTSYPFDGASFKYIGYDRYRADGKMEFIEFIGLACIGCGYTIQTKCLDQP